MDFIYHINPYISHGITMIMNFIHFIPILNIDYHFIYHINHISIIYSSSNSDGFSRSLGQIAPNWPRGVAVEAGATAGAAIAAAAYGEKNTELNGWWFLWGKYNRKAMCCYMFFFISWKKQWGIHPIHCECSFWVVTKLSMVDACYIHIHTP